MKKGRVLGRVFYLRRSVNFRHVTSISLSDVTFRFPGSAFSLRFEFPSPTPLTLYPLVLKTPVFGRSILSIPGIDPTVWWSF